MEQRFTSGDFPNYFLRDCNILEGIFIENNFSEALRMLNTEFDRCILKSKLPPKLCHECLISASLPVKLAPYIHLLVPEYGLPFQAYSSKHEKVQELINEELDELMKGIYNMKLAKTPGDRYYTAAEQHFLNGMAKEETVNRKHVELSISASLNFIIALYEL